jgi:protein disulfide-isomerase
MVKTKRIQKVIFNFVMCLSKSKTKMHLPRPLVVFLTGIGLFALSACSLNEHGSAEAKAQVPVEKIKTMEKKIKVEIWSDIMCPFCYIGKRNFEAAMKQYGDSAQFEIVWKSYQLDPDIVQDSNKAVSVYQYLADRKGIPYEQSVKMHDYVVQMAKEAGLEYHFEKAIVANSMNAHRLIQKAKEKGLGDEMEEVLFKAYFMEGKDCGNKAVLGEMGKAIGMSTADIEEAFSKDEYAYRVKQDIQEGEAKGLQGVPFFVFNNQQVVSGAQPPQVFLAAMRK